MYLRKLLTAAGIATAFFPVFADSPLAKNMLSHVEKITVVDTLNVDRDAFFKKYNIRPSAGRLLSGDEVIEQLNGVAMPGLFQGEPASGFTNEYNDYMIWAQPDTTGYLRLAESVRLISGEWDTPRFTGSVLNFGAETPPDSPVSANAAFPFMADDGQTLYFAADNDKSLGGYDIFISTKDPAEGKFLIPGNIGMPFNSAYDDYMMVLDRQTGVGWWASDRNQLEDEVTVYIYMLSDERVNVDPADPNLNIYASLSGWEELLDDDAQAVREQYLEEINGITQPDTREPEFELPMPGSVTYRYFSDFKNPSTVKLMKDYLAYRETLAKSERRLGELREKYSRQGGKDLARQIKTLEGEAREKEKALKTQLSEIYKSEDSK